MKQFDIVVVGGGPGGYVAAIKAAQAGKTVCLVEKNKLGGVCLNWGCIPTKTLLKSVEMLESIRHSADFAVTGLDISAAAIDMGKLQKRKNSIVQKLTGGVGMLLKANGATVINGQGSFVDNKTLTVGDEQLKAEKFIIATGSVPVKPPIPVSGTAPIIGSDEALDLTAVPASMVIIGGGVIGIEFAYLYASLGAKVTVIELMDRILPMVDKEITVEVTKMLHGLGINILTEAKVTKIIGNTVHYELAGAESNASGEKILMSVGRAPNTEGLNLEGIGVEMNRRAIKVNKAMQTNIPGIYAIGDVNGTSMLAHTASMEGIVAVDNILGHTTSMDYDKIPSCIYIQPEIAAVGLTEEQARHKFGEVVVGKFPIAANGKAMVQGETRGLVKVILEPKFHEILGVHIYGPHATDLIAEVALAMNLEATAEEVAMSIHPHPTISEIVPEAFHAALGKAIHNI